MVNPTRPAMTGVGLKDFYKQSRSTHMFVEIVILDKTTTPLEPCLYQLNDPKNINRDYLAFTRLGSVLAIDTQKKVVTLEDDNIVTYHHLIIATGPQSSWMTPAPDKEFAAGIHFLMEALRLQERKPTALENPVKTNKIRSTLNTKARKYALPKPVALSEKTSPAKDPKRVYQVQL